MYVIENPEVPVRSMGVYVLMLLDKSTNVLQYAWLCTAYCYLIYVRLLLSAKYRPNYGLAVA